MVMVGITVLGIFSYARLRVEQMPDVSLPFVFVVTRSRRLARGRRNRCHQTHRVRDQHRRRREDHSVDVARGPEPGVRGIPACHGHDPRDAGCPRQDRPGETRLPARRQGSIGRSRRSGKPAAGRVAGGPVADDGSSRADIPHGSGDRQGHRERSRRCQHRRQRPRVPPDSGADQAERDDGLRHRHRSGGRRHSQCQPGCSRGAHHARRAGLDRACRRQDQGAGAVWPHHRRAAGGAPLVPLPSPT